MVARNLQGGEGEIFNGQISSKDRRISSRPKFLFVLRTIKKLTHHKLEKK
jgi:hypothetical protein